MKTQCLLVVALWIFTATPKGAAGVIIIPTPDLASRGWYDFTGYHDSTNDNYVVGNAEDGPYRNFFVFALPVLQPGEWISSIDLILYCPPGDGYNSSDPTETYQIFTLENTTIAALRAGGDGLTNIFTDLGEGEAYSAGFLLSAGNAGTDVTIPLNAAFLAYAGAHLGQEVAMGGALTSLNDGGSCFGFTGNLNGEALAQTRLSVTVVPEPSVALLFAGMAMFPFRLRGQRRV